MYDPLKPGSAGTSRNLLGAQVKVNLDSPECQAFQKCFAVLCEGISDPAWLATQLYSRGMISREARQAAELETLPAPTRTRNLLSAVEHQIITSPEPKFRDFLDILHHEPSLEHLARQLEEYAPHSKLRFTVSLCYKYNVMNMCISCFA